MIRALILSLALASPAGAFQLDWPVACTLGQTCFIQHYFDHDPGPGTRDYTCGTLTYDRHEGTDIALPNRAAMAAGVDVLAAAPGTVLATRDGIADFEPFAKGKDCGNGVLLDNGDGWQTQYCHMKLGSVAVKKGDQLSAGAKLGLIGQSGNADFPHLHLTVRQNGTDLDPFEPVDQGCGEPASPGLWTHPMPYVPSGFMAAGFSSAVPGFDQIQTGLPTAPLPADAPAIVLWAEVYGGHAGDQMAFQITAPDGSTLLKGANDLTRNQDQLFRALGTRLHAPLKPGQYAGRIDLIRDGKTFATTTTEVTVP